MELSSVTPWWVLNMRLNLRMSVKSDLPQPGQVTPLSRMKATSSSLVMASMFTSSVLPFSAHQFSMSLSARWRILHALQSISGSLKVETWPEATHTSGFMRMAASSPTL